MAGNRTSGTAGKAERTDRRGFIRVVGAGVTATAVGTVSTGNALGAGTAVDLGEEGLGNGDLIDPYLAEFFTDGTEVRVPAGAYEYAGDGLGGEYANATLVGAADGATLERSETDVKPRPDVIASAGTVRIENVTLGGQRGVARSPWRVGARAGATLSLSGLPDARSGSAGSTDGPASLPNRIGIHATGDAADSAGYDLAVTGDLTLDEGRTVVGRGEGLWLTGDIAAGRVGGHVRTGVDAFFYSGQLDRIEVTGGAAVDIFQG